MLLISRLVKEKRKSAYVEFNDSETCKGFLNSAGKRLKNVSFINDASEEDIARLPGKAFEHIIIDFGKAYEERRRLAYYRQSCGKLFGKTKEKAFGVGFENGLLGAEI